MMASVFLSICCLSVSGSISDKLPGLLFISEHLLMSLNMSVLCVCLSLCLHLPACLYPFIYPTVCLYLSISVSLYISICLCLSSFHLPVCLLTFQLCIILLPGVSIHQFRVCSHLLSLCKHLLQPVYRLGNLR